MDNDKVDPCPHTRAALEDIERARILRDGPATSRGVDDNRKYNPRSLRDEFAFAAMTTILADDSSLIIGTPEELTELSEQCYSIADAMMKARET